MKVYVGCALAQSSPDLAQQVLEIKRLLREKGHDVLEFLGTVEGTNEDVYRHDIEGCVERCDAFVAICDLPSLGLGYEIAYALSVRKIPVLAVAHSEAKVSRLIQGIPHPQFVFKRYQTTEDIMRHFKEYVESSKVS